MRIRYKQKAVIDIQITKEYIEKKLKNRTAAADFAKSILKGISMLATQPYIGIDVNSKFGIDRDWKCIVVGRHIVFYEIVDDVVLIIRVLDTRQDYLAILLDE